MTLAIEQINTIPVNVDHAPDFTDVGIARGRGMVDGIGYVVVQIRCAGGIVGYGECGRYYEGETQDSALLNINRFLAPRLLNCDALDVGSCLEVMDLALKGNSYAKMAVETAIWDARGKALNVSVATMLGGGAREYVEVSPTLNIQLDPAAAADQAMRRVSEGYRCVRLKIGDDARRDLAAVAAIRKAVGNDIGLRVDANQGYTKSQAIRVLRRMEEHDILLIEQPLDKDDLTGMGEVAAQLDTPVSADESATGPRAVFDIARLSAADGVQVKIGRAGGLTNARLMAEIARIAGLVVGVGCMLELGIGAAANLQLAATVRDLSCPMEFDLPIVLLDDIVANPLTVEAGRVRVPTGPGLGIEIDSDKLEYYRRQARS